MTTNLKTNMNDDSADFLQSLSGRKVTIANTLWAIRECEEMTQVEMAKMLGISRQYLCDVEHNRRSLSARMAADFAIKLGYSPSHFVQMALQDELDRYGFSFTVHLDERKDAA